MKKYLEVSKIYMKSQLVWRADSIFNMLFTVTKILFAYLLWGTIFSGKSEWKGFTFDSMMSYYIISSFLNQIEMSDGISGEISVRIRNGTFSKYMVLPINMQNYFLAMEIGVVAFNLILDLLAAMVWIFVFGIHFSFTTELRDVIGAIILILLGLFFMVQLNYYLGLLTLKYQEISTFLMIKNHLVALITGSIIPLMLFPEKIITVMRIFPFYYITYLPSMILIGKGSGETIVGIGIMACWCVFLQFVIRFTWQKYRRKYDGVGI